MSIPEMIKNVIDRTVIINGKEITVHDYEIATTYVLLKTKQGPQKMSVEDFRKWYQSLETLPAEKPKSNDMAIANNIFPDLQQILMDNIEKVKSNKGYIPQAAEINKNVNSIINLARTQIDMMKQMKG